MEVEFKKPEITKSKLGVVMLYCAGGDYDVTRYALNSLKKTTPKHIEAEVFLVEQGISFEDTINEKAICRDNFTVHHIHLPYNVGIIRARSMGTEMVLQAGCDFCLICDNDVVFGDGWFGQSMKAFKDTDGLDIIGIDGAIYDFRKGSDWFNCVIPVRKAKGVVTLVDYVGGYYALIKSHVFKDGCQFDPWWIYRCGCNDIESFGGCNEDTDFCFQVQQNGGLCGVTDVPILHLAHQDAAIVIKRDNSKEIAMVQDAFNKRWKDSHISILEKLEKKGKE